MIKPHKGGPAYPLLVKNTNPETVTVFGEIIEPDEHLQFTGISKRDYFAASAPVGFDVVLRVWGDPDVNLHDDTTRMAFMSVWAMLCGEYADAMLAEGARSESPIPMHTDGPNRRTILAQPAGTNPEERRMKDIDWSKAPEGATHWEPEATGVTSSWMKLTGGVWYFWTPAAVGNPMWNETSVTYGRVSRMVKGPTTPQWNGTGLPPVGVVCLTDHEGKELKVEILAYGKHGNDDAVLVAHLYDGVKQGQMYGWIAEQCEFRPIRTPEQIAAEERGAAVQTMVDRFALYAHPDIQWHALFEQMYDCGCRMTAEDER